MPSAPFVSFNDYLNANAGSLQQERGSSLAAGQASIDALASDVKPMTDAAYQQGAEAGKAQWSAQRAAGNEPGAQKITSSEQYKAPTDFQVNFSTLPGQEQFAQHKAKAETDVKALTQGGLGSGKTAFEAGMIGADTGYQQGAQNVQKQYQDSVNNYLNQINQAGQAGVASFKPAPIMGTGREADPAFAPTIGPDGSPAGNEGPVMKPRTRTYRTKNGERVPDEEQYP